VWATLLLPVADPAFPLALAVPRSPSHSPSLQVSGANYAGTVKVTRARGTYPTSLPATLPPQLGTVRCGAAQRAVMVRWAGPSPAVLPGLPTPSPVPRAQQGLVWSVWSVQTVRSTQPASQPASQCSQSECLSRSHPFLPSFSQSVGRIHLSPSCPSSSRGSRTGLVPGKRVHAHCTLGLPHTAPARPFHLACTFLPTCPCLACLHLAPCYLLPATIPPPSFLPLCVLDVCCQCARACVRVRVRA
jgi:hypothetical protein